MQHSSIPTPMTKPEQPAQKPVVVQEPPKPRNPAWFWLAGVAAFCAGAYWLYQKNLADEAVAAKRALTTATRTATVSGGKLLQTLRLTGTTGPEQYVTILGPQLRGSRSFGGGGGAFMGRSRGGGGSSGGSSGGGGGSSSSGSSGGSSSSGGSTPSSLAGSVTSNAGGGSSSGSSSSGGSTASMGSGSSGASVGGVRSSSSAMRAATTRSSSGVSRSSSSGRSSSSASAGATMGGEGLGSTSGSFGPSGGGSPGGGSSSGDFGSVLQDLVKPGSRIEKNAKIAEFDRQYMLQRVDDYKAGVDQQELNMQKMVADLDVTRKAHEQSILIAKGEVDKAKLDLKTVPVRSAIDSERFQLALEEAEARYQQLLKEVPYVRAGEEAQLNISKMDLQQSKLELRRSEQNADRMVMRSPMAGMVVMLNIFRGGDFGQVQEGDPVMAGMPFMKIVDPSSMVVEAVVNQTDVERIRVGAKAIVHFDAFPDLALPGHVFSVAAMPKSSFSARGNYLKEIPVRIKIEKMDPRVIPDLSASVDVVTAEEEAAVIAPLGAIFQDEPAAKPYVYVRAANSWEKRAVELGLTNNTSATIKSGLKAGETVAEERPSIPAGQPGGPAKAASLHQSPAELAAILRRRLKFVS